MAKLPRLEVHNIAYLKKKKRALDEAQRLLRQLPLNERVRNALFTAGVMRLLADNVRDIPSAEALLKEHWDTVREVMCGNFSDRHVNVVFEELEASTVKDLEDE
jgi:hypothetical protein